MSRLLEIALKSCANICAISAVNWLTNSSVGFPKMKDEPDKLDEFHPFVISFRRWDERERNNSDPIPA